MTLVLVFAINCHVSEKPKTGPANSQSAVDDAAIANPTGLPDARAIKSDLSKRLDRHDFSARGD